MPAEEAQERAEQYRTTEQRLTALEDSVAAWAEEVRTRRLLIVGGDSEPRIVCEVSRGTAELRLEAVDGNRPRPALVLYATTATTEPGQGGSGLGPATGFQLWADGDAMAALDVWCDEEGRWRGQLHVEERGA